jgi:hypothetical protein
MIQIRKVPKQELVFIKKAIRANIYLIRSVIGRPLDHKLKAKVNIRGPVIEVTRITKTCCGKEHQLRRLERKDIAKQLNINLRDQTINIPYEVIVA